MPPDLPTGLPPARKPAHVPLRAMRIVKAWQDSARTSEEWASMRHDRKMQRVMWDTHKALLLMRRSMNAGVPDYMFALVRETELEGVHPEDIQAIATVTSEFDLDGVEERPRVEVLHISEFVVKPTTDDKGSAAEELLRKLIHWGAATGRMVSISEAPGCTDYYESLGFEPKDSYWPYAVLGRSSAGSPPRARALHLVTLEYEARDLVGNSVV